MSRRGRRTWRSGWRQAAGGGEPGPAPDLAGGLAALPRALAYYLRKVFVPWPQRHYVAVLPGLPATGAVLAAGAALLGAGWRNGSSRRLTAFAALWFAAALAPSLGTLFLTGRAAPVAERYLYLPSAAAALALGWAASRADLAKPAGKALAAVLAGLFAAYGVSSVERSLVWRSDLALWSAETRDAGNATSYALAWLGSRYRDRGETERARELYARARSAPGDESDRWMAVYASGLLEADLAAEARRSGRGEEALARMDAALAFFEEANGWRPVKAELGRGYAFRALLAEERTGKAPRELLERAKVHLGRAREKTPSDPVLEGSAAYVEERLGR